MASEEYATALYQNHNKGFAGRWNWIQGNRKVALPPLMDPHVMGVLPLPGPSDSNLALEDSEPPSATARAPVAIPASPATLCVPSLRRSARRPEKKAPSQSPSGKGDSPPPEKQLSPISQKGVSSGGPSKVSQPSRPYSSTAHREWSDWN